MAASQESPGPPPQPTVEMAKSELLGSVVFYTLFIGTAIGLLILFFSFITDFVLALLFAAFSVPFYRRVLKRVGPRPWLASTIVTSGFVVTVAVPTVLLAVSLSAEAANAFDASRASVSIDGLQEFLLGDSMLATYIRKISTNIGYELTPEGIRDWVSGVAGAMATFVYAQVNAVLSNVLSGLFHFVVIVLMLFYFLIDGWRLKRFVFDLSPLPREEEELLANKFKDVGRAILFGNGVGSLIQGVLGGFAMAAVGLPSAILWGTIMTVFAFLPLVGISVVVIPAAIYLALGGRLGAAIAFFAFCTVQALVVENVVKTRLIGSHMKMHNLLIFLALLGGLSVFGVSGLLYGPLLVAFFLTLAKLYEAHYKERLIRVTESALQKK